jgi:hypothetical protein
MKVKKHEAPAEHTRESQPSIANCNKYDKTSPKTSSLSHWIGNCASRAHSTQHPCLPELCWALRFQIIPQKNTPGKKARKQQWEFTTRSKTFNSTGETTHNNIDLRTFLTRGFS